MTVPPCDACQSKARLGRITYPTGLTGDREAHLCRNCWADRRGRARQTAFGVFCDGVVGLVGLIFAILGCLAYLAFTNWL